MLANSEEISLEEQSLMTLHSQDVSSSLTQGLRMTEHFQGQKHTNADMLPEDSGQRHAFTARKLNDSQAAWRYEFHWDIWFHAALREQLTDDETIPLKVEAGQHLVWKDAADRSSIYKSYWAQWNSLVVT